MNRNMDDNFDLPDQKAVRDEEKADTDNWPRFWLVFRHGQDRSASRLCTAFILIFWKSIYSATHWSHFQKRRRNSALIFVYGLNWVDIQLKICGPRKLEKHFTVLQLFPCYRNALMSTVDKVRRVIITTMNVDVNGQHRMFYVHSEQYNSYPSWALDQICCSSLF